VSTAGGARPGAIGAEDLAPRFAVKSKTGKALGSIVSTE
jgi:hypothetical protein